MKNRKKAWNGTFIEQKKRYSDAEKSRVYDPDMEREKK